MTNDENTHIAGISYRDNNPIFHHIEMLLFEALQTDITEQVEAAVTAQLLSHPSSEDDDMVPASQRSYPHPLATLIEPYVIAALHEKAPLIVADILSQQSHITKIKS